MNPEILSATERSLRRTADLLSNPLSLDSFDTAARTIRQASIDAAKLVAQAVGNGGLPFLREDGNILPIADLLAEPRTPFNSEVLDERWVMVWEMLPAFLCRGAPAEIVPQSIGLEGWKLLSAFPGDDRVEVAVQLKSLSEQRRRAAVYAGLMRHLADLIAAESAGRGKPHKAKLTDASRPKLGKQAIAIATLVDHPDWSNEQIAEAVGCHVKTLSSKGWKKFKGARLALADGRNNMPMGSKDKETGDMEAWNG